MVLSVTVGVGQYFTNFMETISNSDEIILNASHYLYNVIIRVFSQKTPLTKKKAELSQRRPHDAPNIGLWVPPENLESPDYPTASFHEICNGRLFRSILRFLR